MSNGHLSYYDAEEIENAVDDLLDLSMIDDAEYLTEAGMNMHPNDEDLEKLLIWIYLHNHKGEKAEQMFAKYRNDGTPGSHHLAFNIDVMHGHPRRALETYIDQLRKGNVPPNEWADTVDEMYDAIPLAILSPFLKEACPYIKGDAELLGKFGSMLFDAHLYDEAIEMLEKSLDLDAYDIYSWQDLARCYMLQMDIDKCIEACDYGLAIDEGNALLGFIKGYILQQEGKYAECIPLLTNARRFAEGRVGMNNVNASEEEIQQQIELTYELLGFAYIETSQNDQARECFSILAERNPGHIVARMQLANLALLDGDINEAKKQLDDVLGIDPKFEAAQSLLVSVLLSTHEFDKALATLKNLIKQKPRNRSYLMAYAQLCLHTEHKAEADSIFRRMLKLHIKDKSMRSMMRDYFLSIGDEEAAKEV
jgi:tetratricopeptide (TPR) repeat protein